MMKKLTAVLLCATVLLTTVPNYSAEEITTSASAAVLYCVDNNTVLYQRNMNKRLKMASTTKLMTALLTLEVAEKHDKTVTFTADMIEEGSSMYLKLGEKVRLSDLCVGMMLPSGNDAATAAAVAISGSREKFAERMNRRAGQLGLDGTSFVTPSGLDDKNHYSTARDMAVLMKACLKNKQFREISGSKSRQVHFIYPPDKTVTYQNHNRLLSMYPCCISGKTGYTSAAGRCLVTAARKNGVTLIAVTLNDRQDWDDHIKMYEHGLSVVHKYSEKEISVRQDIVGGTADKVKIIIPKKKIFTSDNKKIKRRIHISPFEYAPVKKGERAGRVEYYSGKRLISKEEIYYAESVDYKQGITDFLKGLF